MPLLVKHALIKGFLVGDTTPSGRVHKRCFCGCRIGKLKYKEDVVEGLENASRRFTAENFGKLEGQHDPTR